MKPVKRLFVPFRTGAGKHAGVHVPRIVVAIMSTLALALASWVNATPAAAAAGGLPPVVVTNRDGRLEVFSAGSSGEAVYHRWQTSPGGSWSGWASLGTPASGASLAKPAVIQNSDGRLEVFVVAGGRMHHKWQTSPGGGWSGWDRIGTITNHPLVAPTLGRNRDGRLEVFIRTNSEGYLLHAWQRTGGGWSDFASLGRPNAAIVSSIAVASNADGRLEVVSGDPGGSVSHIYQTSPGGGWSEWGPLTRFGQSVVNPYLTRNADGRLEVFGTGSGPLAVVAHAWQDPALPGGWSSFASLGGVVGTWFSPVADANADGRLEVFKTTVDGEVVHAWQRAPGGGWSGFARLGSKTFGTEKPLALARNADGRLEVFTADGSRTWHAWQRTPGGSWSEWAVL